MSCRDNAPHPHRGKAHASEMYYHPTTGRGGCRSAAAQHRAAVARERHVTMLLTRSLKRAPHGGAVADRLICAGRHHIWEEDVGRVRAAGGTTDLQSRLPSEA